MYMKNYNDDKLLNALESCKENAEKGYALVKESTENIDVAIKSISEELKQKIHDIQSNKSFNAQTTVQQLVSQLHIIQETYETLPRSIMEDINSLSKSLFSITLFGRTMAGKSTLMEILIRGSGDSIGKGAQRTTRDVRTYIYRDLYITDVPGIAAFEGEEDEEIAFEAAKNSNLILFLITDDAPQASEAEFMSKIIALGKPVICIINIKANIACADDFIMFKRDIKKKYDGERLNLIKQQFIQFGQKYGQDWRKIQFVNVHLKAAFLAQKDEFKEIGEEIYNLSNFEKLENLVINEIIKNGSFYKFKTYSDIITVPLVNTFEVLFDQSTQNSEQGTVIIKSYKKLKKWADNFTIEANKHIDSLLNTISSQLHAEIASFAENNYDNKDAGQQWNKVIQSYNIEQRAQSLLKELADNVINELSEMIREINNDIKFTAKTFNAKSISMPKFTDWKFKFEISLSLISGLICIVNPLAGFIVSVGFSIIGSMFEDYEEKITKARKQLEYFLQENIDETIKHLGKNMRKYLNNNIISKYIESTIDMINQTVNSIFILSDMQYNIAMTLNKNLQNINKNSVKYALEYLGYTESIEQVINVARIHGSVIMITLEKGAVFNKEARLALSTLLKEQVFFVKNNNKKSMLYQTIGKCINIQKIRVLEINKKPRIAYITFSDSINQSIKNRIRLAQQVTEILIMR